MAKLALNCPLDGLAMGLADHDEKPGQRKPERFEEGHHIHIEMSGEMTCPNGHQWKASGDFLLEWSK